jgi:uncharacterized protein YhfF
MPQPGDFVIILNGVGRPRFICRTTEVTIKPLFQVDEAFGWDEGGPHARLVAVPIADISLGKRRVKASR